MKQTKIIPFDPSLVTDDNVYTRNGRKARIICTDKKDSKEYSIIALITDNNVENAYTFTINGKFINGTENTLDLVIHQEIDIDLHFEPFQKVLVRHSEHGIWRPAFYSHEITAYIDNNDNMMMESHYVIGDRRGYNNILPYDDFKHLCNTSDDPKF